MSFSTKLQHVLISHYLTTEIRMLSLQDTMKQDMLFRKLFSTRDNSATLPIELLTQRGKNGRCTKSLNYFYIIVVLGFRVP
jgi:hypothetical protein